MYTYHELINDVIKMSDENIQEYYNDPDRYLSATNRALQHIATDLRAKIKEISISQNFPKNNIRNFDLVKYTEFPLTYNAVGKAYYFECNGSGIATITDDDGERVVQLDHNPIKTRDFIPYRGFCSGNTKIVFSGDFEYDIRNIAIYSTIRSNDEKDIIPFRSYVPYDFKELDETFIDFASEEITFKGNGENRYAILQDFKKSKHRYLHLNYFDIGEFNVLYRSNYDKVPETAKFSDIKNIRKEDVYIFDLEDDLIPALIYMSTYHAYLTDDPSLADTCRQEYENIKLSIFAGDSRSTEPGQVLNTMGWY